MLDGDVDLVFNTTEGWQSLKDSHSIRATALHKQGALFHHRGRRAWPRRGRSRRCAATRLKSRRSNPIIPPPRTELPHTICCRFAAPRGARRGRVLKRVMNMASADKVPMLAEGHRKLTDELKRLQERAARRSSRRSRKRARTATSRENAEYHAAKERQGQIEATIADLEDRLSRAMVIDPTTLSGDKVVFGATVTLIDEDEKKVKYQLVGQTEADAKVGRISYNSPLGRALIGRQVGEEVEVSAPSGDRYYEIKKIEFI